MKEQARRAARGWKQIKGFTSPANVAVLHKAGVSGPRGILAALAGIPWVLGRGPSLGVVSSMNAMALPGKTAIIDSLGSLTFSELERRANRSARLLSDLGVEPGDPVVTLLRNGRHQVEVVLAAQKLGVSAIPLNTWSSADECATLLQQIQPKSIIYDIRHRRLITTEAPYMFSVGDPSQASPRSLDYESECLRYQGGRLSPFTVSGGSPEVVIHTSGTTGTPKGARRDPAAAGVDALTRILQVVPLKRDDVIYLPAPLFHSFGLGVFAIATMLGATVVLPERFDPQESLDAMTAHRATVMAAVPVMLNRLLATDLSESESHDLSSVRTVLVSGSALTEETKARTREVFGDVLYDLYGSTEAGWVAIATPRDMLTKPGSVGRPVSGIEVGIFDEQGQQAAPGTAGEIYVKSDVLFEGYTSGETRPQRDGFISIGDIGYLDSDGYLFVEGRADDIMVIGGENVHPLEIEAVIRSVGGVEDVAVIGMEDPEFGVAPFAFVVGDVEQETVISACRSSLARFKVPRGVIHLEELPRNATGKVLRSSLAGLVES